MHLKETLHTLALGFVDSIMEAIRHAPIEEISEAGGASKSRPVAAANTPREGRSAKGARLTRRSAEQIEEVIDSIVTLLRKNPEGLRAENIRTELDLDVREVPRVLRTGVESKKLVILSGQKRATTYGLPGSRKVAKKPSKAKKSSKVKPIKAKKPIKAAKKPSKAKKAARKAAAAKAAKTKAAKKPIVKQLEAVA